MEAKKFACFGFYIPTAFLTFGSLAKVKVKKRTRKEMLSCWVGESGRARLVVAGWWYNAKKEIPEIKMSCEKKYGNDE